MDKTEINLLNDLKNNLHKFYEVIMKQTMIDTHYIKKKYQQTVELLNEEIDNYKENIKTYDKSIYSTKEMRYDKFKSSLKNIIDKFKREVTYDIKAKRAEFYIKEENLKTEQEEEDALYEQELETIELKTRENEELQNIATSMKSLMIGGNNIALYNNNIVKV